MNHSDIIEQSKKWITDVVVGCNFCPFAARELKRGSIHYEVLENADTEKVLGAVVKALQQLEDEPGIETTLLILPGSFAGFDEYLDVVEDAEILLEKEGYEGVYQLASFHPQYLFAGSEDNDPANYTNRSPYPMLHFLREESVSKAVDSYPGIDEVPDRNIAFAQDKGLIFMQELLEACRKNPQP
jgi:hypothetical protein